MTDRLMVYFIELFQKRTVIVTKQDRPDPLVVSDQDIHFSNDSIPGSCPKPKTFKTDSKCYFADYPTLEVKSGSRVTIDGPSLIRS